MKKILLFLVALGATSQVMATMNGGYDEEGNYYEGRRGLLRRRYYRDANGQEYRRGLLGRRRYSGYRDDEGYYHYGRPHATGVGQAASDAAHGSGEVASNVFHDIVG